MGARPVANLNSIRFGSPNHEKTKYLLNGVVSGIGGYGNCIGVPTVGGETEFDECYNGNILVNAMNIGVAKKNKVFYSIASGVGNPVVYVGSKTAEMESMEQQWHQLNLMKILSQKNQPFKLVMPLLKNYY